MRGLPALVYALHRFRLGGPSIIRLLYFALLALGALWSLNTLPGGRWVGAFWLILFLALWFIGRKIRHSDYVSFQESAPPAVTPQRLLPNDKVAIHATGQFTVEGKYQRLTWLPGFYRTFATNEHALLCLARDRRWLFFAHWPADEPGMWYAFITPDEITRIRWGELQFGANRSPALALDYRLTIPANGRRRQDQVRAETLYIACATPDDAATVLADLLADPVRHEQ